MDSLNETGGAGEQLDRSPMPPDERGQWLDTMADMQAQCDRRYELTTARIARLERKATLNIPDEMKTFLLMLGLYVGVQLLLPFVIDQVAEWRSRS